MKILKKISKILILSVFIIFFLLCGLYLYAKILPKLEIRDVNSFYLYDEEDNLYFEGSGHNKWVSLDNISPYVIKATLLIEDKNFYNHHGFNIKRIIKATLNNIKNGKIVEGASTITQQYAKNLYLDFDKTFKRKLNEFWLTIRIETHYDKDTILEGYLNTINYGHGMYGIENASQFYFNKHAKDLTLEEASILVNIPKSPANYSPINHLEKAKERQQYVLKTMLNNKAITNDDYNNALSKDLVFYGKKNSVNLSTIMYYQDAVFNELKSIKGIPLTYINTGGIKIYTNIDLKAQETLENSINKVINNNDEIETSAVMINPNNGKIIALIGGRNYNKSQYNRAIYSKRQVGSVMKPILYYTALQNGFTPSSTFISEKTAFNTDSMLYKPKNYGDIYADKKISMAAAIAYSDNIYAVKTHLFLGTDAMIDTSYKIGIKTPLKPLASLPLGTIELNMIEIANAYATFASLGKYHEPYFIEKVTDMNNNVLYEHKKVEEQVLNEAETYILNDLLSLTYDYNLIDYNYPTNISINSLLSNKYANKSGSTETDNWTIGYNKNVVTAIWVGYDDNQQLKASDYKYVKKAWAYTMESYLKDKDNEWYQKPNNVIGVLVNPISGEIAKNEDKNKKILYYISGSEPISPDS